MDRNEVITAIEAFAAERGIAPATVTSRAVQNSRLYHRMVQGGDCTTGVARRIMSFIAGNGGKASRKTEGATP